MVNLFSSSHGQSSIGAALMQFDAGSCIDGRLTSAWNWGSKIEKKDYYHIFKICGFVGMLPAFRLQDGCLRLHCSPSQACMAAQCSLCSGVRHTGALQDLMESSRAERTACMVLWRHVWLLIASYMPSTVVQQHFTFLEARNIGLQQ